MKKIFLPVLFCFLMIFSMSAIAAGEALTAVPTVSSDGKTAVVTVNFQNPGIVATRLFIKYDKSVLRLNKVENGNVFTADKGVFSKDLTQNPYIVLWDDSLRTNNVTNSGALCKLTFDVVGQATGGTTPVSVTVDDGSTFDYNLNEVAVNDATCNIKVAAKATSPAQSTTVSASKTPVQTSVGHASPADGAITSTTRSAQPSKTTTKAAATTTKANAPTTAKGERVTLATGATKAEATTVKAEATVGQGAPASNTTTAENTPVTVPETAPDAENPGVEEVFEATLYMGEAMDTTATESGEASTEDTAEPESASNNLRFLWFLLLIPAGVVVAIVIQKKK